MLSLYSSLYRTFWVLGVVGTGCVRVLTCPFVPPRPPHSSEDEEDDTIHMGNAVMTFYAALIDLLGRCAPEMHVKAYTLAHAHTRTRTHTRTQTYTHVSHMDNSCW